MDASKSSMQLAAISNDTSEMDKCSHQTTTTKHKMNTKCVVHRIRMKWYDTSCTEKKQWFLLHGKFDSYYVFFLLTMPSFKINVFAHSPFIAIYFGGIKNKGVRGWWMHVYTLFCKHFDTTANNIASYSFMVSYIGFIHSRLHLFTVSIDVALCKTMTLSDR